MSENRHSALGLSDEDVLEMYRYMLLTRKLDERMWLLNRSGKINFVISGQGQEAAQIGASFALNNKIDYIAPYYRDLGIVLCFGMTPEETMLHNFARATDPNSGGRQMPGHYGQKKNRIITGSSPVSTQVPHAVGFALAAKLKQKEFVTFVALGDGSTNQGDFHEGLNFAGVHKLPLITFVENNKYAISVPFDKQVASKNIAVRAESYGMQGVVVDGNDPLNVYEVVKEARKRAVNGDGPTLIEAVTDRMTAHSSDDNDAVYRTKDEITQMRENDCIVKFNKYLKACNILTDDLDKTIHDSLQKEVNDATDAAENAPFADPATLYDYVYEKEEA